MRRKLTTAQIREVCIELQTELESPSVRSVMTRLQQRYGACGRTERVAEILGGLKHKRKLVGPLTESSDLATLRQQLADARQRAARAEELERRHQDFWAARYQEKVGELQLRMASQNPAGVSSEQYLRLYQRAMELVQRLARYEEVEPLLPPPK